MSSKIQQEQQQEQQQQQQQQQQQDPSNSKTEAFIEQAKENVSGFVGRTFEKLLGNRINSLLDNAIPSQLMNVDKVREKVDEVKQQVEEIQENMIQNVSKNTMDSAERAIYVIPLLGEAAAAATSLDSAVAAGRNVYSGFTNIKDKIDEIKETVDEAREEIGATAQGALQRINPISSMPSLPQMPSVPSLPQISSVPSSFPATHTQSVTKKGGNGNRNRNKNKSATKKSMRILNRTRKSLMQFYGGSAKQTKTKTKTKTNKNKNKQKQTKT